jgi:hypothetical protein
MGVKIECIATIVVELINKSDSQGAKNFYTQGWEKIFSGNAIGHPWPYLVSNGIDDHQHDGGNNKIPEFHTAR